MRPALLQLTILLPFEVFTDKRGISRVVAESNVGSVGFLPQRLDCVMALIPSILVYEIASEGEVYVAIGEGILIKAGEKIVISARNAIGGTDLGKLQDLVKLEITAVDKQRQSERSAMAKLESGFLLRLAEVAHG